MYYAEDGQTIIHGDSLEVMATMASESVDIVVTSPPYNMGLQPAANGKGVYMPSVAAKGRRFRNGYGTTRTPAIDRRGSDSSAADTGHDDAMPQDEYDAWQRACLAEMWRIARVAVFYNHRPRVEHGRLRVPLSWDYGPAVLRQIITWDRGTGIDIGLGHFCTRGEWIMVFTKPDFRLVNHSASGMGDVWNLGMAPSDNPHPAPFPVSLPARCIAATGARSVLDPFLGSGTTLRAALDAGITGIGIELTETYCAMAVQRLAQGSLFA